MAVSRGDAGKAVAELAEDPRATVIFSDFDGTLAPIVPEPDSARLLPGAAAVLRRLARVFGRVALVSGRPVGWLAARLAEEQAREGVELYGLHGLERWNGTAVEPVDAARPFTAVVRRLVEKALEARVPGLTVEDKVFGLTLHWREAAEPAVTAAAATVLAHRLAVEGRMLARPGKASVELVPPIGIDKGTIVRERAGGLRCAAYVGDDVSDLLAFDALDDLARSGARTARVAVWSSEVPPELIERADLVVDSPEACVALLGRVAAAAEEAGAARK